MYIIYDLIFLIFAVMLLPVYLFKRKFHRGFLRRFGILPKELGLNRPIWIHAVSVGEAMAVRGLIEELRKIYPASKFVISTVTATGNKIVKNIAKEGDFVTYLPLDFSFIVKNTIDRINPALFIIAETEIWPNLISCLYHKNIPIITVNGRISDSSFKGYLSTKFLLKPVLGKINLFCAQTNRDGERFKSLGVSAEKVKVTGNMKFDAADYTDKKSTAYTDFKKDYADYRSKLNLGSGDKLFVAGSTHAGEEDIILEVYKELQRDFLDLRLLIAPRHPERAGDVERIVNKYGFNSLRITQLNSRTCELADLRTIFILDTVGQLINYYAIADIVFVGGSLVKKGGHNILEPASLGKPVLFGPYMFNFRDIADLFLENKACILVNNRDELRLGISYLLNNPGEAIKLTRSARELILQNQGATKRNAGYIREEVLAYGD